jgi:hypothetical protein
MRKLISYEMQEMFVGSEGAFEPSKNTGQYVSRLDFIQNYGFNFSVNRQPLKQIGSSAFASRQSQLAPDVSLKVDYLLNDGWNEKHLGLDVSNSSYSNPLSTVFSSTGDRNFYVLIAQDQRKDALAATNADGFNVLGIGNAFIGSYSMQVAVNNLATVSCEFVGANASISNYSAENYLPSVNTASSGQAATGKFGIDFYDNSRSSRVATGFKGVFDNGCYSAGASISAEAVYGGSGVAFGHVFENFTSFSLQLGLERKALYGFGSNYPTTRKIQKPVVATVSLESIVESFGAENLAQKLQQENVSVSGYNFDITFRDAQSNPKLGIKVQNAFLDSYSINPQIGGNATIQTNWSFEVSETTGILMSGSYGQPSLSAIYINESINP